MRVIVTGATGMVGKGVLLECLEHPAIERVLVLGRRPLGLAHPRLQELVHGDLLQLEPLKHELSGYDACFFCLGTSSLGMKEADYRRVTHDLTLAVARTLLRLNPGLVFTYVSGAGTDSTGRGRTMWARVKGETENALLAMGFRAAYMFRPGYIHPLKGVTSRTPLYRALLPLLGLLYPLLRALFPSHVTTTEDVGLAMIQAALRGSPKHPLGPRDINTLAAQARGSRPST